MASWRYPNNRNAGPSEAGSAFMVHRPAGSHRRSVSSISKQPRGSSLAQVYPVGGPETVRSAANCGDAGDVPGAEHREREQATELAVLDSGGSIGQRARRLAGAEEATEGQLTQEGKAR